MPTPLNYYPKNAPPRFYTKNLQSTPLHLPKFHSPTLLLPHTNPQSTKNTTKTATAVESPFTNPFLTTVPPPADDDEEVEEEEEEEEDGAVEGEEWRS